MINVAVQDLTLTFLYFRFTFKPKLRVLTAHVGWRHEAVHSFCLDAIKSAWHEGFAWLSEVGLIDAPCLQLFNLANYMGWPLAGVPVRESRQTYDNAFTHLGKTLSVEGWVRSNVESLLDIYISDHSPFGWRDGNAAIRIAEIAGLIHCLGRDMEILKRSSVNHLALIQADMFNLGSAEEWVTTLYSRALAT